MCSVRAKSGCRIVKLLCPPLRCRMFRRKKLGNLAVSFLRERLKLIASLTISFNNTDTIFIRDNDIPKNLIFTN